MSDNLETCVDPYLDSFEQTYAAENYTAGTIVTYRCTDAEVRRIDGRGGYRAIVLDLRMR